MSNVDNRNAEYWLHQIWHALTSVVSTLDNSLNVNVDTIGGTAANYPVSVSIDAYGEPTADVFGRLAVAEPHSIFDSKQVADKQPQFWDDQQVSGGGTSSTYLTNQAATRIAVGASTAGRRVRQTFTRHNYQAGKAQIFNLTAAMGARADGITRRWGAFSANNGVFFEQDESGVRAAIRENTSGTPNTTYSPYLDLTLDGETLDETKGNIWFISFEWLGVGDVVFGAFVHRRPWILYIAENTNHKDGVYMSTPNLPLRYEINNDGTGGAAYLDHICSAVISSGGREDTGYPRSIDRGVTPLVTLNDGDLYPTIAMRIRSGYQGATVIPRNIDVMCTSTAAYRWVLLLNPTVAGTAFSFTALTNSAVEADASTTNASKVTGGIILASGYGQQSATVQSAVTQPVSNRLRLGVNIAGTADVIVLAVQRITGTTESFYTSVYWEESI